MNETQVVAVLIAIMVFFCSVPVAFFFYRRGKMDQQVNTLKLVQKVLRTKIDGTNDKSTLLEFYKTYAFAEMAREITRDIVGGGQDAKN